MYYVFCLVHFQKAPSAFANAAHRVAISEKTCSPSCFLDQRVTAGIASAEQMGILVCFLLQKYKGAQN